LRILVVSQYFWPENFRVNDLVKEWVHRGHQVTVLTGIPNYPVGKVFDVFRAEPHAFRSYEGTEVFRVPMLPRGVGSFWLILNYLSFVLGGITFGPWRLRGKQVDVIFVFGPSPATAALPALWLGEIKKAPVVFWVLDLWPESLSAVGVVRSPTIIRCVRDIVGFIYNRCTLVLGQSKSSLAIIARHCDDISKIRYFPSWAEDVFDDDTVQLAPEISKRGDVFTVLFAGNIGEAQDIPAVLDAAERLKDNDAIRWVTVGDGRKFDWLKAAVVRRGLENKVLLTGRFAMERMPSFYAHADVLLVSLRRDPVFSMTIPGKVQSYLMAGIPLLGMLDGEGAAVIRDAQAGLTCEAGDDVGLAQAVLSFKAMSVVERKQMGLNGRDYARREFGRPQLMGYLDALLAEAMTMRKAKSCRIKR